MKKVLLTGANYTAPVFKELNVRCEAGFTTSVESSVGIGDIDTETGAWD